MRFIVVKANGDPHIADYNVFDSKLMIYYPMVSESVAYEIAELLNMNE